MNEVSAPNFNLGHRTPNEELNLFSSTDDKGDITTESNFISQKKWELDVKSLIGSQRWLQLHGLRRNQLKLHQILTRIGFKQSNDYVRSLKKPVGSYYGEGLFHKMKSSRGTTYNITASKEVLNDIENSLKACIQLMKRRQEWLTSGSRKIFGVIQEHCVCIVLDVSTMVQSQFEMFIEAASEVLKDQASQLAKINIIRAQNDMLMWQSSATPVNDITLKDAMNWFQLLDRMAEISYTSCTEAIMKALEDDSLEAIYLFCEGDVSESSKELLRQKLKGSPIPLHTVSFNATKPNTINFLQTVASETGGRFHAFVVKSDYEDDVMPKASFHVSKPSSNKLLSQKTRGCLPNGAGVREDVFLVWKELEEARNILADIQSLIVDVTKVSELHAGSLETLVISPIKTTASLSSKDWLEVNGLEASQLTVFHALASYAFKHIDDVLQLQKKPTHAVFNDTHQTLKLIEAKYCKSFPHIMWKDNEVVHVYVSAELFRTYERKMKTFLGKLQQRIDWLQQGSREIFGSILEERIYLLIDSSFSMGQSLPVLKEKLLQLFQEQLRHKTAFNLVKFESKATSWNPRLVEVNEENLRSAWNWIKGLEAGGSTNTLAALRIALSDPDTEGIYLLTDGRPDQPAHCVLSQIQLHKPLPIHTIAFNCNDVEANKFLHQLALETGGRYHCYTTLGGFGNGPLPFESEDVSLLKAELQQGKTYLKRMTDLRARCVMLDCMYNKKSKKNSAELPPEFIKQVETKPLLLDYPPCDGTFIPEQPTMAFGVLSQPKLLEISHKQHRGQFGLNDKEILGSNEMKQFYLRLEKRRHFGKLSSTMQKQKTQKDKNGCEISILAWKMIKNLCSLDLQPEQFFEEDAHKTIKTLSNPSISLVDYELNQVCRKRDISNRLWLKTNGIIAKKMTLMDALGSTVIKRRRKYIPILNEHVMSKVFDDVLPIAHVSPRNKQEIRLVNPNAAHLEDYEERLRSLLQIYRDRLNEQIWKHLSSEERERYGSKDTFFYVKSPEYEDSDRMHEVNTIFEEKGWPLAKQEIEILLEEIRLGERYIQQSIELRMAAAATNQTKASTTKKKSCGNFRRKIPKRLVGRNINLFKEQEAFSSEKASCSFEMATDESQPNAHSNDSETTSKGSFKASEETMESTDQSDPDYHVHDKLDNPCNLKRFLRYLTDKPVIARSEFDGYYYDAAMVKCLDMSHAHVQFNHGEDQITATRFILPFPRKVLPPPLQLGDYVLAKTRSHSSEPMHYIPGLVIGLPGKGLNSDKHYEVLLFSKMKINILRQSMLKIDHERYRFTVQFIRERMERHGCEVKHNDVAGVDLEYSSSSSDDKNDKKQLDEVRESVVSLQNIVQKQTEVMMKFQNKEAERTKSSLSQPHNVGVQTDTETGLTEPNAIVKFADDGWYYRGCVKKNFEDDSWKVTYLNGVTSNVTRCDVLFNTENAELAVLPYQKVIALHPHYENSYAPATIESINKNDCSLKFYDGITATHSREEVYFISNEKYEDDVIRINQREQQWEGRAVIARNDLDGRYHIAVCKHRIGSSRCFSLQWNDGRRGQQYLTHMFDLTAQKHEFRKGDHILAVSDVKELIYLPGKVENINSRSVDIQFLDGKRVKGISAERSYFVSREYFANAVKFYLSVQQ